MSHSKDYKGYLKNFSFHLKSLHKIIEERLQSIRFKIVTLHTVLDYLVSCLVP
jgi:ABC-type Zn uptake system ZnuABC Zn-binding protein ZnuA